MFNKLVVTLLLAVMLLCVGTAVVGVTVYQLAVKTETAQVSRVGQSITDYTLPVTFQEHYAVQILGYSLMEATTSTGNCHIFLAQAPDKGLLALNDIPEQVTRFDSKWGYNPTASLLPMGQMTAEVRGKPVTFLVSIGINGEGRAYQQMTAQFEGRGGPAMVNISGPVDEWDQPSVDAFIASLK